VFSTAEDNQTAVTVHVLQGEREMASGNKSLGRFDLSDIPPAPRGMPQVEVTFDIDANGILHVSAKDKATGKEQSIRITASSGLSEAEIQRMVQDAEAHKDEDRKARELVDVRNQADGMIHATEKAIKDLGDKVEADEKKAAEDAIEALKEAMKGDDKAAIEAKIEELGKASGAIAQKAYAQAAQDESGAQQASGAGKAADDVVDAEFEEVKDNK